MILATKSGTPIIGQVASVMGWIMDGIYKMLDGLFGVQNLGLCIIIFSIIIYLLMTPLQIKQQKFSKLSAFMQPELQKVQKKYQGKRDQISMQKMNEETQAIYQKYGVSPTGSCVQLAIQFPILMALWQVIYKIPAYVGSVKDIFTEAVSHITAVNGYTQLIQNFITDNKMTRVQLIMDGSQATSNSIIDFLYALSPSQWEQLSAMDQFSGFSGVIDTAAHEISKMQNFFGLNIADQPMTYIKAAFTGGAIILAIAALMIPILSWVTQMLNIKLMPQAVQQDGDQNAMMSSMKMMNTIMPLMSAVFCFTFPVGLGIYWISSAVVRSVQQLLINRHMDRMNIDDLINENMKKMEKKREKAGLPPQKITNQAHQSVKNINNTKAQKGAEVNNAAERAKKVEQSYQNAAKAKPGSITARANMVKDFDERNKKK
ncbi:MAG: membrane protein insertase YidC [Clostridiales bacterium]|nr:membrane protein insertase YidC [Clostridiales bacterium]